MYQCAPALSPQCSCPHIHEFILFWGPFFCFIVLPLTCFVHLFGQVLKDCPELDVVENGCEVLEALKSKTYDLILMDIHMPLMDGLEASRSVLQPIVRHAQ